MGSLYYTEESFDDFYFGKGSTYPDVQGGVGILFEQASSRGHLQDSANGPLSFPFTIRNQVTSSLSMLAAATSLRGELLEHQRGFYREALADAAADARQAIVFGDPRRPGARRRPGPPAAASTASRCTRSNQPVETGGVRFPPASLLPGAAAPAAIPADARRSSRSPRCSPTRPSTTSRPGPCRWPSPCRRPSWAAKPGSRRCSARSRRPGDTRRHQPPLPAWEGDDVAYAFSWNGYGAPDALYQPAVPRRAGPGGDPRLRHRRRRPGRQPGARARSRRDRGAGGRPDRSAARSWSKAARRGGRGHRRRPAAGRHPASPPSGIDLGSPNLRVLKKPTPGDRGGRALRRLRGGRSLVPARPALPHRNHPARAARPRPAPTCRATPT